MNSEKIIYDWKRYWVPHSSYVETSFEYSLLYNDKKLTLADLRNKKCLILLGDAALGKSVALKQEYEHLFQSNIGVYLIDLKYTNDYASLKDKFLNFQKYCYGKSKIYLFLDSFDESQIVFNNIVNCLIENLQVLDLDKIFIRIACRTVVFPQYLYDELINLYCFQKERFEYIKDKGIINQQRKYENNDKKMSFAVEIYNLLPLNTNDINMVLEQKGINKNDFYNSRTTYSETLKTPITALYIIDNYLSTNDISQFDIYNNLCLQLCNEYTGQTNRQILSLEEKIKIVSTLFTMMLFSNKYFISYDKSIYEYTNNNTFYTQKYFNDIKNVWDVLRFSIPASNIEEILNTGLFTRSYENINCIQKTYMEFLVAKFILDFELYDNFKNLMFDEYGKVLPPFINTICWLADKNDTVFEEVYTKDPDILLTSIVSFSSEEKNIKLLKKLYELLESDTYVHGLDSYNRILRKLSISKDTIIRIVEKYLNSANFICILISIELLNVNKITELKNRIFNIAISTEYNFNCRIHALYFLKEHSTEYLQKIDNYIDNFMIEDTKEATRYVYTLINILSPNYLSVQNFTKLVNQNLDENFYYHIEPENIIQNEEFHKILLSRLLQPFIENQREDIIYVDKILKQLIENLTCQDVIYVANIIYNVLNCCYLHSIYHDLYFKLKNISRNQKYRIFDCIFNTLLISENNPTLFVNYYNPFFDKLDIIFLVKQMLKIKDPKINNFIYSLCVNLTSIYKITYACDYTKSLIQNIINFIKTKKLTCHQYHLYNLRNKLNMAHNNSKKIYYKIHNFIFRKRPIDFFRKILNKIIFSEKDWNNCIWYLSYISDNQKRTFSFCPINYEYIDEYYLLTIEEQKKLLSLAEFYVSTQSYDATQVNNRLTTNYFKPYGNMLIVPAMYMLYKQDTQKLQNLLIHNNLIKKSLPYILNYPIDNHFYNEITLCRIELLQYCISNNEKEFLEILAEIIDTKLSVQDSEIYLDFLEDFYSIDNEQLNDMLFEKLNILMVKNTYTKSELYIFEHIAKYLTIKNYKHCVELFISVIENNNKPIQLQSIVAKFLAHYQKNTFNVYKELLDNNEEFANNFIKNISNCCFNTDFRQNSNQIKLNLNSIELAQFFIILEKYYPSSEDTRPNGFVTTRDNISELRRSIIDNCINSGDLVFFDYIKNNSTLNIPIYCIQKAKRNYTKLQYQFITIEELISLIVQENSHIVLNNLHLYDIVQKALNEIQVYIREDAGYLRVWNEINNTCCPKDERALSDEIKRLLKTKLSNMIINREVEISPKIAGSGNNIPDLIVECKTKEARIASVIIEVKGCWNPKLKEAIKTQLYDSYLRDEQGYQYGIYLIGWYWCNKWQQEDKNKKIKQIKVENRFPENNIQETIDYFNEQAQNLSNEHKKIQSIVLDLSLPN